MFSTPASPISGFSIHDDDDDEVEDCAVPSSQVDQAKQKVREMNEYGLIATATRNVLFVGKTRSGKSTAVGVLKDPCYQPPTFTLFSETTSAKFQSFSIQDKSNSSGPRVKEFTLHIIDTPGLFEVKATNGKEDDESMEARTNESIIATISKCLENEITKLNCVVMFCSIDNGVSSDDVKAIQIFANLFKVSSAPGDDGPPKRMRLALCVTRADNHTVKWREHIIKDIKIGRASCRERV